MACRFLFRWVGWCALALGVVGVQAEPAADHSTPEPWQMAGIQAAMKDPSPHVRALAAFHCGARYWSRQCLKMDDLLPLLQDADPWVKVAAAEGLTGLGAELTPATAEALVDVLLRERWLQALGRLGPEAAPLVVPRVLPLLEKADAAMKLYIVDVLLQIGKGAAPYAQALLPLLQEADPELRALTLRTLREMEIGESKPPNAAQVAPAVARALLPLLKDADPDTESAAQFALASLGPEAAPLALPAFMPLLDDENMRTEANWCLGKLGKTAAPAVAPLLLPRLRHAEGRVRSLAMIILHTMGPAAAPYAAEVRPLLKDTDDTARYFAASLLRDLGAGTTTYFKDFLPLLQDADPDIKSTAMSALAGMGAKTAPQVVQALLPLLQSTDGDLRRGLESAFVDLRQEAAPMAAVLLPALRKADARMQIGIVRAMAPIKADATPYIGLLRPYLQDRESDVRRSAAQVLAGIGTSPEAAAFIQKEVLPLLKDSDPSVRDAVVQGLPAATYAGQLLPMLHDSDSSVRDSAIGAFIGMGEKAAPYARDLLPLVGLPGDRVYYLFKDMGAPAAPVLLPALLPLLSQPGFKERHHVLMVLDELGNLSSDPAWQCAALAAVHTMPSGNAEDKEHDEAELRFLLHLWSGHDPELLLSVRWLGRPSDDPMPPQGLSASEQQSVLSLLLKLWPHSAAHPALRQEIARRILSVAQGITAAPDEKVAKLLQSLDAQLQADAVAKSQEPSARARAALEKALAGKGKPGE